MKNLFFFAACFLSVTLCFATTFRATDLSCPTPENVTKVTETSSSISFDWDDSYGATQFLVYYVKDGNASAMYQTSSSNITLTGLAPGVYEFHFMTDCGSGTSAEFIIIEDLVMV